MGVLNLVTIVLTAAYSVFSIAELSEKSTKRFSVFGRSVSKRVVLLGQMVISGAALASLMYR